MPQGTEMDAEAEDPLERRRDELRRIVYGTPGEPSPGAVAELVAIERRLGGRADGGTGAPPPGLSAPRSGSETPSAESVPNAEVPRPDERPTRRWRFATAVTVLASAVGAIALLGPVRELLLPPRGLEVFERAPSVAELDRARDVTEATHLDPAAASSLRPLGSAVGYEVWTYRDGERVCLLTQRDFWFAWISSCVTLEEFRERGLVRRIPAAEISDLTRPSPVAPDDVVLLEWGPRSTGVEWRAVPAGEPPAGSAPMTYEEWASTRVAARLGGS
ncbi:hypothetical protein [Agromyces ramosus]|uniref:Uncharacterized protein n=1 Tax=Agromyces ramosus TaxID=33879 RepID=A0ABU0R9E7_9MICO|nr:hypothetical protein [Agromyces ramosus]MDQ0894685.1 hypothetical protein [Agromyces ramosus]